MTKAYTTTSPVTADEIVATALDILAVRLPQTDALTSPDTVKKYLVTRFSGLEHEVFSILLLDNRHRVLRYEELFRGTIDGCSLPPREVVKSALTANAVILAHNHPSGVAEPSRADTQLTKRLTDALALVDVRILDHLVVGGAETVSFAERGLL